MARIRREGRMKLLRAHVRGTRFGPGHDQIDVEFVAEISAEPHRFGATLRNDARRPSHEAMFQLLRDGLVHNLSTTVEYDIDDGKNNGLLVRVELRP